jgi:hypothetical protein
MKLVETLRRIHDRLASEPEVFSSTFVPRVVATPEELAAAEERIGAKLPADLRAFYLEQAGGVVFAWSVREDHGYRIGAEEGFEPRAQFDVKAPGGLARWTDTCFVPVVSDGSGSGIALDLEAARTKKPFVDFDHDRPARSGRVRYATLAAVANELAKTGFASEDLAVPGLMRFLRGGALRNARKPVVVAAPRPAPPPDSSAPPRIELTSHKYAVSDLVVLDAARAITVSPMDKTIRVHAIAGKKALAKLPNKGGLGVLLVENERTVLLGGRAKLERIDVDTGARTDLASRPYLTCGGFARDGTLVMGTTASLERHRLDASGMTRVAVAERCVHALEVLDARRTVVASWEGGGEVTVTTVDTKTLQALEEVRVTVRPTGALHFMVQVGEHLLLMLDSGEPLRLPFGELAAAQAPTGRALSGPVLQDGERLLVARWEQHAILDVHALPDGRRIARHPFTDLPNAISAMALSLDGSRLLIGGVGGWVRSYRRSALPV